MAPKDYERERQTRKQRIDPKLKQAGWSVVPHTGSDLAQYSEAAVEEFPTANGPADYALCDSGEALGAVEAKKVTLGPQNVLTQAQRYSIGFTDSPADYGEGYRVPFLYDPDGSHRVAPPALKRRLNQAVFKAVWVDDGPSATADVAEPFATLLEPSLVESIGHLARPDSVEWVGGQPTWVRAASAQGLKYDEMAPRTGFEPVLPA